MTTIYPEGPSKRPRTLPQLVVPDACDIELTVEANVDRGISGTWSNQANMPAGCTFGLEIEYEYKESTWDYFHNYGRFNNHQRQNPNQPSFIAYGLKPGVTYDFRIVAVNAAGRKNESNVASATVRYDTSATADANSPEHVRAQADNSSGVLVTWGEYTAPGGRTVSAIVVEWKTGTGAAMTAEVPHSTDTQSDYVNRRHRITGLTDGQVYTVRAAARTYETDDATKTTSDAWSVPAPPIRVWSEPTQLWFIDSTPSYNRTISRVFMTSDSNKTWGSTVCSASSNGGSAGTINCPTGTLVSLSAGGTITVGITGMRSGETASSSPSVGVAGGGTGFLAHASGGAAASDGNAATNEGRIVVVWDAAGTSQIIGSLDAYVVQHRKQNADSTWPDWPSGHVQTDTSERIHTFNGLADGTWQVRVRARAANVEDHDGDPNTDPKTVHRLGFTSEILTVTVDSEGTGTVRPRAPHVTPGASQSLIVEWELPASGSIPFAYEVRHRLASATGDVWSESTVLRPRLTSRICSPSGCVNPRRYEITGLTAGVKYDVDVRAENANGWGEWTRAFGHEFPND